MSEIIDSYKNIRIIQEKDGSIPLYEVELPQFSEDEKNILKNPGRLIDERVMETAGNISNYNEKRLFLREYLRDRIHEPDARLGEIAPERVDILISLIIDRILGYGPIGALIDDDDIEDIMVNGVKTPVYVFHRKHGICKTNIKFETSGLLYSVINRIAHYAGREISEEQPLLDAHMPDGSRANVAIPPAAPEGPSITIRKFKHVPYSIIDLIIKGTTSVELAAFLWICVDGMGGLSPINMLVAGGSGSGKTTMLNALTTFIPQSERVITVEDTRELNLSFLGNWVPLESTPEVLEKQTKLSMKSLLKNSLRMRPDRIVVGEVRGEEIETLFVAMDIGLRGSMGTIHANNARDTTIRLTDPPMNLPIRMVPLLDLIVVQQQIHRRNHGNVRRTTQVTEISGVEQDLVQLGDIFNWSAETDSVCRTQYPIQLKDKIAKRCGVSKMELNSELRLRAEVLQYMIDKQIRDNNDVVGVIRSYQASPESVISEIKR